MPSAVVRHSPGRAEAPPHQRPTTHPGAYRCRFALTLIVPAPPTPAPAPGCDKNMPGTLMAMARLNRPALMIYGGTIKPGHSKMDGSVLDIVSAFQSYGGSRGGVVWWERDCCEGTTRE